MVVENLEDIEEDSEIATHKQATATAALLHNNNSAVAGLSLGVVIRQYIISPGADFGGGPGHYGGGGGGFGGPSGPGNKADRQHIVLRSPMHRMRFIGKEVHISGFQNKVHLQRIRRLLDEITRNASLSGFDALHVKGKRCMTAISAQPQEYGTFM